jgi:hypothetical protein
MAPKVSCQWTDSLRVSLVSKYKLAMLSGKGGDNGLKTSQWTTVVSSFNVDNNVQFERQQLQSQMKHFEKEISNFQSTL